MAIKTVSVLINGQTYELNYNNTTKKYEATINAPSNSSYPKDGHYYDVTVKAEDMAGNKLEKNSSDATFGESLQLVVKEKNAPTITILEPTQGQLTSQNKPTIKFKVVDDDSGVNLASVVLKIDNSVVSGVTNKAITDGYEFTYTPTTALNDGDHTITVNASDNDGNASSPKTLTFKVLATAPTLSIENPANNSWFKNATVAFNGTTNAETLTVKVGMGAPQNVTITGGAFSGQLTLAKEGANVVTFEATSESGVKTTVERTLNLDTKAPVIKAITITPNPVNVGSTYVISVDITD